MIILNHSWLLEKTVGESARKSKYNVHSSKKHKQWHLTLKYWAPSPVLFYKNKRGISQILFLSFTWLSHIFLDFFPIIFSPPLMFFCCNAALRTTRGSPYVCMYVCMCVSISFFAIYSKNLQATDTSKFVILCNNFLRMPLWKKIKNLVYEDTKYKIIFLL